MSDRTLRRLAYGAMALCAVSCLTAVVLEVTNPSATSSWGSGGVVANTASLLTTIAFGVAGLLVTHREPRNRIGWIMLAIGAAWSWSLMADGYVLYSLSTRPGSLPRPDLVAALSSWSWIPAIGLLGVFLILLFPDGHLPSPRWRFVAWAAAAGMVLSSVSILLQVGTIDDVSVEGIRNPLGIASLSTVTRVMGWSLVVLPVAVVLSAASLVVRFRTARGVERLQLKWLATAGALVACVFVAAMTATLSFAADEPVPGWLRALQDAALISFLAIPLAIGVAILKHRLYGIDVVINKSFVFGALATFITTVYVGIVVGVGSLVGRGDEPSLPLSIAATAVVAVAFQPVRARVQRFANRLVYGERATPYEVLSDFADRMGGTYASGELLPRMARTVADALGAASVEVWLVAETGLIREAAWPAAADDPGGAPTTATGVDQLVGDGVVTVRHRGELLGAISVTKPSGETVTPSEDKLLADVAAQAGLVLRNVRLIEDLRASRQRLVGSQDQERRRLERNLHDGAQQSLVAVALMLRMVRVRLGDDTVPAAGTLDEASDQLGLAIEELRELARGIHPAILTERGLGPALASNAERAVVPTIVDVRLDRRPPGEVEATLYHVAAEALRVATRRTGVTEVWVDVREHPGGVRLEVSCDGTPPGGATDDSWLLGLRDRVAVLVGSLHDSDTPGGGWRLVCTLPVPTLPAQTGAGRGDHRTAIPQGAAT